MPETEHDRTREIAEKLRGAGITVRDIVAALIAVIAVVMIFDTSRSDQTAALSFGVVVAGFLVYLGLTSTARR